MLPLKSISLCTIGFPLKSYGADSESGTVFSMFLVDLGSLTEIIRESDPEEVE
jgi:hypothetical protein